MMPQTSTVTDFELVSLLEEARGALLSRRDPLRERWLTVWLMMVGCHHLLLRAEPFLQDVPLDHRRTEAFARVLLKTWKCGAVPDEGRWLPQWGKHPWPAGFYLVSAEHRLANSLDRLTTVFRTEDTRTLPAGKLRYRCKIIFTKGCPNCRGAVLDRDAIEVLQGASKERRGMNALAKVYDRVNELKHEREDRNQVDGLIERIDRISTQRRWDEARTALYDLCRLYRGLGRHAQICRAADPAEDSAP